MERIMSNEASMLILLIRYSPTHCDTHADLWSCLYRGHQQPGQISRNKKGALTLMLWGVRL